MLRHSDAFASLDNNGLTRQRLTSFSSIQTYVEIGRHGLFLFSPFLKPLLRHYNVRTPKGYFLYSQGVLQYSLGVRTKSLDIPLPIRDMIAIDWCPLNFKYGDVTTVGAFFSTF